MKYGLLIIICIYLFLPLYAQKADRQLQRKIEAAVQGHAGEVAVYVKNLKSGRIVAINADTVYSTASMIKVPILAGVMDQLNRGVLSFSQEMIYHDSLLYPGVDILGSFKPGEKIELSKLMMLMMTMSDNTASIWLQMLAGTGTRINQLLDSMGFIHTRVNSRTAGREAARARYGWGQTTAREMATFFEKIYRRQVVSEAASTRMLRFMNRNYWDGAGVSSIPPEATVFSKNGALNAYRSETLLVRGYKSEYVYCIITNNNRDTSWTRENEASQVMRKVSAVIWNHFEPRHPWVLPPDSSKFY